MQLFAMFGALGLAPAALLYLMPGWRSYWTVIGLTVAFYIVALVPVLQPVQCGEGACDATVFGYFLLIVSLPVSFVAMLVVGGIRFVQIKTAMGKRPYRG